MTKIETLNKAYVTKLEETNSHDEAILHVAWLAYQDGVKSMGGEVTESHSRYFDDMLGNPMNALNKLSIKDAKEIVKQFSEGMIILCEQSNDGWIEWNGGKCPVKKGIKVIVKYRNGKISDILPAKVSLLKPIDDAGKAYWIHDGMDNDIIAYKVIS